MPPAPYPSETAITNAYTSTYQPKETLRQTVIRQTSPDISSIPSSSTPTVPFEAQIRNRKPVTNPTVHQSGAYISGSEMSLHNESYPKHVTSTNGNADPYNPQKKPSSLETTRSHPPGSSSIGPNSSVPHAASPSRAHPCTSPTMVPLPYSPPEQSVQEAFETSSQQDFVKTSSQYSLSASPPISRRALNNDSYMSTRVTNYIPRTASPLQKQYIPAEYSKVPTALNLNEVDATPSNTTRPDVAGPFTVPKSDMSFHSSVEGLSPHHTPGSVSNISLGQYAPSPSLLGANDPLSRTSSRAPVVTFGFGGKMITCFHGMPGLNTGFDVAFSARTSSELKVRILRKILSDSVLNSSGSSYPGPLVSDPGTVSLSLVRSTTSSHTKVKKSALTTYLLSREEEINQGLGFLSYPERDRAENKLILVKLLKVLVENDGRFFGSYVISGITF